MLISENSNGRVACPALVGSMRVNRFFLLGCLVAFSGTASGADEAQTKVLANQSEDFFERRVRPIFVENCVSCHGPEKQRGGLRLDSAAALRRGGDNGPVVKSGDPDSSLLIQAIRQTGELKMPPKKKLP